MEELSYNDRKVAFVSNLHGSNALDVMFHSLYVCLVIVTNRLAFKTFILNHQHWLKVFFLNFFSISLPLILGVTLWANYIHFACLCCGALSVFLFFVKSGTQRGVILIKHANISFAMSEALADNRYVLFYGTTVGILAVDFTIFPRHLAKTEIYGFSVMDVGVGLFGFYYGLLSREVRFPPRTGDFLHFFKTLKSTLPPIVIALGRLIVVKLSDYPTHVSEYGVHWNFFFTLAAVRIVVSLLCLIFPNPRYIGYIGLSLFSIYSVFISYFSEFNDWQISSPEQRSHLGLIEQNKEGLVSLPGFVALYLLGMQVGYMFSSALFIKREQFIESTKVLNNLRNAIIGMVVCGLTTWLAHNYLQPCSRRLSNFAYIFWVMFNFLLMLTICLFGAIAAAALESTTTKTKKNDSRNSYEDELLLLPKAFNRNTLALFLLANILTGIINLSVQTIFTSPILAYVIVIFYCSVVSFVACFLYTKNITVKFW